MLGQFKYSEQTNSNNNKHIPSQRYTIVVVVYEDFMYIDSCILLIHYTSHFVFIMGHMPNDPKSSRPFVLMDDWILAHFI